MNASIQMTCKVIDSLAVNAGIVFKIVDEAGDAHAYSCLINHEREDVRNVGYSYLSDLCRACGLLTVSDSDEFHGLTFDAMVAPSGISRLKPIPLPGHELKPEPRPSLWRRFKARLPRIEIYWP